MSIDENNTPVLPIAQKDDDEEDVFATMFLSLKTIGNSLRQLQRDVAKKDKKLTDKRKLLASKSNFSNPVALSDPLCAFLDIPSGSKLPRTEVMRRINTYIKENALYSPTNKRVILPDDKLKSIIDMVAAEGKELTYFTMQKYNKHNFPSTTTNASA